MMMMMMMIEKKHSPSTEAFYRKLILPEEEKAEPTPSRCGFRWFRSENVVCIEHYRVAHEPTPRSKAS
jgi:hypothetical protein